MYTNYHYIRIIEPPHGKTNNVVSEQVRHKPTCTVTEKSKKLEISDKGADQLHRYCEADLRLCFLHRYCEADLRLCFRLGRLLVFPCGGSFISVCEVYMFCCLRYGFVDVNVDETYSQ